jgi:hypothetical protein
MTMQIISQSLRVGRTLLGIACLTVLASCGGHDDGAAPIAPIAVSNTPPASASADVSGFIAFMKTLVATQQDASDPLDLTAFVAPTIDTTDPDPSI